MILPGHGAAGKARSCPHCRATILESASVCPACHHYLRFDSSSGHSGVSSFSPLRVEGTIRPPTDRGPWEYSVLLAIHDERGREIGRQVVGVGALQPSEERTFVLAVEVMTPASKNDVGGTTEPAGHMRHSGAVEDPGGVVPHEFVDEDVGRTADESDPVPCDAVPVHTAASPDAAIAKARRALGLE